MPVGSFVAGSTGILSANRWRPNPVGALVLESQRHAERSVDGQNASEPKRLGRTALYPTKGIRGLLTEYRNARKARYLKTTSVTRRFCDLASRLAFSAIGADSP